MCRSAVRGVAKPGHLAMADPARAHRRSDVVKDLDGQCVDVGVGAPIGEHGFEASRLRLAWSEGAHLLQKTPLILSTRDSDEVDGAIRRLLRLRESRDDTEPEQEGGDIVGESAAVRRIEDVMAAAARPPDGDGAVGGPQMTQEQRDLTI